MKFDTKEQKLVAIIALFAIVCVILLLLAVFTYMMGAPTMATFLGIFGFASLGVSGVFAVLGAWNWLDW